MQHFALQHSPRSASATLSTCTELSLLLWQWRAGSAPGSHAPLSWDSYLAKQAPEQSCQAGGSKPLGKEGMGGVILILGSQTPER